MSEDHTEKTVMPDIVRHLLDTVPVSPLSPGIIDYNQPEWLAEFNRRGERIAELESERDRMRKALEKIAQWDMLARSQKGLIAIIDVLKDAARKALEGVENVEKDS